jgi:hypothetical protein
VAFAQRGDPERPVRLRVPVGADAKPAEIDQAHRGRAHPFRLQRLEAHVLRHGPSQLWKPLAEEDQLLEFRLLLVGPEFGMVELLLPPGGGDSRRLELAAGARADPDVAPGGRDPERLDAPELRLIGDPVSAPVEVPEMAA